MRQSTLSLTVDLSVWYYQLVTEIHSLLRGEIRGVNFESVELYSDTGYPLAISPYKYLQRISEWNLEQDAMLYVYPKNIHAEEISSQQLYQDTYSIKVAIESTDIILSVLLCHDKLFCCELKTILSLQLHIPTDVIELRILSVETQSKEIPDDTLQLELSLVVEERMFLSIHILQHWKEESYLGAFNTNLYKSCVPQNNVTDWNYFNCLLLYLSKEQLKEKKQDLLAKLGLLRRISCSPPLVYALHRLLTGCTICLPHRVAINEGVLTTLSFLLSDREPGIHHFSALWMYLEKNALKEHSNTEVYETHNISKHTRDQQKSKRLLQVFPSTEVTIVTWSDCPSAHEPFLYKRLSEKDFPQNKINQRFPLKHPIELYKQYLESGIDYGLLQSPMHNLTSYSVFLGPTKGRYDYFDFFDPHDGKPTSCIPHDIVTSHPMQIETKLSYHKLIIFLDISWDMSIGCERYIAGRDQNEPNFIITPLDMAIWIIELLIDSLIRTSSVYMLGIVLISNSHPEFINGVCVLQAPTIEYLQTLAILKKFVDKSPPKRPLEGDFRRSSDGIIVNALFHLIDKILLNKKDHKLQVFLLTNHRSDMKYYGSRVNSIQQKLVSLKVSLNTLILSDGSSMPLSDLSENTKGKYLDQKVTVRENNRIPSHFLIEYYSLFEERLDPLGFHENFESYDNIYSAFRKTLTNSDSTLDMAQRKKDRFIELFSRKNIPNQIQILRQISSYSKSPNPYCKLLSIKENIQRWLCIIQGPDNSPYQNSVLFLEISFGVHYPRKPPTLRFLSSYFHPNVRLTGDVCHPILFEEYNPSLTLRQILDSIHDMICSPVPSHAVRYKVMEIFSFHKDVYGHLVESFLNVNKFKRSVSDCLLDYCAKSNSQISHPELYLCPLTKELFDNPVITPEGNSYERHAILQHLKNHSTDPVSNSQLAEGDLVTNKALLSAVFQYRKKCCARDYWWEQ